MRLMTNLFTIREPSTVADGNRSTHPELNIEPNWNPDSKREDKTRLQKHIETADLNKEELMGSQTDSWESSMGLTQTP